MRTAVLVFLGNLVLLAVAFVIAGFGHGINAAMMWMSAPATVFAAPFYWAFLAFLTTSRRRWAFPALAILAYLVGIIGQILNFSDDFRDPYRNTSALLHQFAPWMVAFILLYLLEQIFLWRRWLRHGR